MNPRTGMDDVERRKILPLPGPELRPLGRPTRSQLFYRLHYPGSHFYKLFSIKFDCLADDNLLPFKYNSNTLYAGYA
jgi:hypothetical protein